MKRKAQSAKRSSGTMDIYEARGLAQQIVLADYADTWKQPKAFLHEAIAKLILTATQEAEADAAAMRWAIRTIEDSDAPQAQRDDAYDIAHAEHPGAALLAELTAARALVEGVRMAVGHPLEQYRLTLAQAALDAYDAKMKAGAP